MAGQSDPRKTRAWKALRLQVIREEPACWLRLPKCTGVSTTADHIIPVVERPDLALLRSNLRGACGPCNYSRSAKPIETLDTPLRAPALSFFQT